MRNKICFRVRSEFFWWFSRNSTHAWRIQSGFINMRMSGAQVLCMLPLGQAGSPEMIDPCNWKWHELPPSARAVWNLPRPAVSISALLPPLVPTPCRLSIFQSQINCKQCSSPTSSPMARQALKDSSILWSRGWLQNRIWTGCFIRWSCSFAFCFIWIAWKCDDHEIHEMYQKIIEFRCQFVRIRASRERPN